MKKLLLFLGAAIALSTSGCIIRERGRGGFHEHPEVQGGEIRVYPHHDWDDRHWDDRRWEERRWER